jgi:uncharacterized protein YlzI (FlbEa/FlbD family)
MKQKGFIYFDCWVNFPTKNKTTIALINGNKYTVEDICKHKHKKPHFHKLIGKIIKY